MKINMKYLLLACVLLVSKHYGQEIKDEVWAYAYVNPKRVEGQCQTLYVAHPFQVPNANKFNYKKVSDLAEEELMFDLDTGFLNMAEYSSVNVLVYTSKDKAFESWQRKMENARHWAIKSDFQEYCEPVEINWAYQGKVFGKNQPYSIYEEGWTSLLVPDSVNSHLKDLKRLKGQETKLDYNNTTVRIRPMTLFKNGKLVECLSQQEGGSRHLNYLIYTNDDVILIDGDSDKLLRVLAEKRPFLFDDDQVIDYVKLLVNTLYDKNMGRATLITRKRLRQENIELRQKELDWDFTLNDPKVIFESRDESLVSAYVCWNRELLHLIIEVDRKSNKLDVLNYIRILPDFPYETGHQTSEGIVFPEIGIK